MKKLFLFFALSSILFSAFGQFGDEKYKSTEEDRYYDSINYEDFRPINKRKVANYHPKYFELKKIKKFSPYDASWSHTPYQDYYDSLIHKTNIGKPIEIPKKECIGKIDKRYILKHERQENLEVFLYKNNEFENGFDNSGIWIAVSKDTGLHWKYYYTGIVERQPVYIKWYSKLPLITEKGKIQIECALFRQINPYIHPGPAPRYKLVKDGICATFNLDTICKDSDNDGLTDIVETKICTDIYKSDTDNDGIPDNLDLNPRFNYPRTEKSRIYEAIINSEEYQGYCNQNQNSVKYYVSDSTSTVMMITDNPDLLGVQPINQRIIFLTKSEYNQKKSPFNEALCEYKVSPMFKVDGMKDTYKVNYNLFLRGNIYLILKKDKGWEIVIISTWIA